MAKHIFSYLNALQQLFKLISITILLCTKLTVIMNPRKELGLTEVIPFSVQGRIETIKKELCWTDELKLANEPSCE